MPAADRDAAYRHYVADVIIRHVTKDGALEITEGYRQLRAVTGKSLGTVKNWLTYRANFPDLPSLARIIEHYKIPPESFYPAALDRLLAGASSDADPASPQPSEMADLPIISLYRPGDPSSSDRALTKYTDHPRAAVFYRQAGSDMLDQIRPGELVLVDPTCEQIAGSGMYLLRFSAAGQANQTAIRMVEVVFGEPMVRLSCGSAMPPTSVQMIPLVNGQLPSNIAVLARVVGHLRQI
ncbi:hypothetical protein HLB44_30690 [Aquincola sp. S2]|uniref:Peptidase S24/S26A/S26B/S26C domain-containing protein n=1 Tax=Pseudaquabacterium terrae TaxID=2732868 RepID=A0ABX2ERV5_9BURK|nr:hypothetical protein [Aquabacterium terrae]NRF71361.1 hypothetical protein [Aquabacterium terrae]